MIFHTSGVKTVTTQNKQNSGPLNIQGIHHITAISGAPQINYDFYIGVLGLRLVKKTVNFDDPQTYHLYYGDATGTPGTLLTFFPFENAGAGKTGTGMAGRIGFAVPGNSFDFWVDRIADLVDRFDPPGDRFGKPVITFQDPDGMMLEIMPVSGVEERPGRDSGEIPEEYSIRSFANATLLLDDAAETGRLLEIMGYRPSERDGIFHRYIAGNADSGQHKTGSSASCLDLQIQQASPGSMGKGTVHHVAFRAKDEAEQLQWRDSIIKAGLHPTEVVDRQYFKSIYFREPGGVLFEIATDPPGMLIDEPVEKLGTSLRLPPWYEGRRARIEFELPDLVTK